MGFLFFGAIKSKEKDKKFEGERQKRKKKTLKGCFFFCIKKYFEAEKLKTFRNFNSKKVFSKKKK